jgi:hypothetical protein
MIEESGEQFYAAASIASPGAGSGLPARVPLRAGDHYAARAAGV